MSLFKVFPCLVHLFFTLWASVLGVIMSIATLFKRTTSSELPIFVDSDTTPAPVVQSRTTPIHPLSAFDQDQLSVFGDPHSPTTLYGYRSGSPPTPTPSPGRRARRSHMLFPTVLTPTAELNVHSTLAVARSSMSATPSSNHPGSHQCTSDRDISFLSNTAEETFSGSTVSTPSLDASSLCSTPFSSPPSTPAFPSPVIDAQGTTYMEEVLFPGYTIGDVPRVPPPEPEIGQLGKRRGFKGAPLLTAARFKTSTFLEVPPAFSPRQSKPSSMTLIKPSSPRTEKRHSVHASPQGNFGFHDPFGSNSDSYYILDVLNSTIPHANLYDFSAYQSETPPRALSLKRKLAGLDVDSGRLLTTQATISQISNHFGPQGTDTSIGAKTTSGPRGSRCHLFDLQPTAAPSSPPSENPHCLEQVAEYIPSMQDAAVIDEIISNYTCHHEEPVEMAVALTDSPILNFRDDFDFHSTPTSNVPDLPLELDVDKWDYEAQHATSARSPERISTDSAGPAFSPSIRHNIEISQDDRSSPTSAVQTSPEQYCSLVHTRPPTPDRYSGLRPLLLPLLVSRNRGLREIWTARHANPTIVNHGPHPLPPSPAANRQSLSTIPTWNRNNPATDPPFPLRSYSLPPGWPVPPTHTHVAATCDYHREPTWSTTPSSPPQRSSSGLDDILNLLEQADFSIKIKAANSGEEKTSHASEAVDGPVEVQWFEGSPRAI